MAIIQFKGKIISDTNEIKQKNVTKKVTKTKKSTKKGVE